MRRMAHLRRIASCFFLTLAILFAALWVRGFYIVDSINKVTKRVDPPTTYSTNLVRFGIGRVHLVLSLPTPQYGETLTLKSSPSMSAQSVSNVGRRYFFWMWPVVVFPTWTAIVLFGALALSIRPAPRLKFSLRDLLTLTTVAAVIIGPLAFWLRAIG